MRLYHGSNIKVQKPCLLPSKRLLDFGAGFYLTSDFEQAKKWAVRTAKNRGENVPLVSAFEIEDDEMKSLDILSFQRPDEEWLHFVSSNRTGKLMGEKYDVIIGPVANDQAIRTVNNYLKGYFSEEIAIKLLLPQKLKDQYVFKTERALKVLKFLEAVHV